MSDILTDAVALDTNVCVFAIRGGECAPCEQLVLRNLGRLHWAIPPQVIVELNHNLDGTEIRALFAVFRRAGARRIDVPRAPIDSAERFEKLGAKKGDALIAAELDAAGVRWLISENLHFLSAIEDLPFTVLSAADALALLQSED